MAPAKKKEPTKVAKKPKAAKLKTKPTELRLLKAAPQSKPEPEKKVAKKEIDDAPKAPLVTTLDDRSLMRFKKLLLEEKQRVMNSSRRTLEDIRTDTDDLPDETDLAVSEFNQALAFKMRDRERMLLQKIDEALARIEDRSFGMCLDCEEPIEVRRLEARPMSMLCVACKEREEHREKVFA